MINPGRGGANFLKAGLAAGVVLGVTACGGGNNDAERDARIAAASRSTCNLVGIESVAKSKSGYTSEGRNILKFTVETTYDFSKRALMQPYDNYVPEDPDTIPELPAGMNPAHVGEEEADGYVNNPDRSDVLWGNYKPGAQIVGGLPVQQMPDSRRESVEINSVFVGGKDQSTTDSFELMPKGDYKKGTQMIVSISTEVTSTETVNHKLHPFDKEYDRTDHVKSAVGTAVCGVLVQTGDRDNGSAGWTVDLLAKVPADGVVESERDEKFRCDEQQGIAVCYNQ